MTRNRSVLAGLNDREQQHLVDLLSKAIQSFEATRQARDVT